MTIASAATRSERSAASSSTVIATSPVNPTRMPGAKCSVPPSSAMSRCTCERRRSPRSIRREARDRDQEERVVLSAARETSRGKAIQRVS